MRKNYRVVVFAAIMVIVGAALGRPLAADEPVEAEPSDIRQRYSDLLQFVTIPPSELPTGIRLIERAEDTPLISVRENPGLIVEPEQVKSIAGFFGLRKASDLESVRAAVTAIYEGKDDGPNEIGVYGIYISDRKTAKRLFQNSPKDRADFSYIRNGPLLLCVWRDSGISESAFEAIRSYFTSAEFKPCGVTKQVAGTLEGTDRSSEAAAAAIRHVHEEPIPKNLAGKWLMTLPAGFDYTVTVEKLNGDGGAPRYRLTINRRWIVLEGLYEIHEDELVIVEPKDPRMTALMWKALNMNVLLLVEPQGGSPTGASYYGATLSRLKEAKPEPKSHKSEPVEARKSQRDQIGTVLGEPVYRDQIREGRRLTSELSRLFTGPVWRKYREAHKDEVTPTVAEIKATAAYFMKKHPEQFTDNMERSRKGLKRIEDQLAEGGLTSKEKRELEERKQLLKKRLKHPARSFAKFMLSHRKFQRHLYKHYGGGRLLWQQAGVEAFDAMWNWLKTHEQQGDFQITDPELRAEFYKYWTSQDDRSALIEDPERIQEFLYPEWAPHWDTPK